MINPTTTAKERAKQLRENATKVKLRLAEERQQVKAMKAQSPAALVTDVRALERIVILDQETWIFLENMATNYDEIARGGK